jgi:anti-sigma regulatory factor (Ser/Thr protein kinase)
MLSFYDLSIPLRCLVILGLFLSVCIGGYLIPIVHRQKNKLLQVLFLLVIVVCAVLMVIYTSEARANLRHLEVPEVSDWLCRQPVLLTLSFLLVVAVFYGYLLLDERRFRRNTITRSSIKEGVDKISSGLCFYMPGGRLILTNSRMYALCYAIVGRDLQNAELFWKILSGGEVKPGIKRLSFGNYPSFRLPDGSVWTFAREELKGFIQLTAADTTLQQNLTDELRDKNLDLAALNLRLRRYGENVDELARAKERLETKVRIHGELGQALLAARRYLVDQGAQEPPVAIWRRNIAMLRKEMETKKAEDPLQILRKAAASAGVRLEIRGQLSENPEYRQFFLLAASETLTNAVFHAGARTLNIDLTETDSHWTMRFTNDGVKPEKPITEGGGLGSLRRKAENMGASMTVDSTPEFALTITGRRGI